LQVQDDFDGRYDYDAVGRGFGLLGGASLEFLATQRVGVVLAAGGRVVNTSDFTKDVSGVRTTVKVLGGDRPIEVNLSGMYAQLGLRFYFDKTTQPIDFGR
jgi:hypothetical protein